MELIRLSPTLVFIVLGLGLRLGLVAQTNRKTMVKMRTAINIKISAKIKIRLDEVQWYYQLNSFANLPEM